MATVVGRLRPCPILGAKFVLLGHNTIRGAAGASILNAEMLLAQGHLPGLSVGAVLGGERSGKFESDSGRRRRDRATWSWGESRSVGSRPSCSARSTVSLSPSTDALCNYRGIGWDELTLLGRRRGRRRGRAGRARAGHALVGPARAGARHDARPRGCRWRRRA